MAHNHDTDLRLNHELDNLRSPAPDAKLKTRILEAAKQTPQIPVPANDKGFPWKRMMAIAATFVVVAFAALPQIQSYQDAKAWETLAHDAGFSDLHDWVYTDS